MVAERASNRSAFPHKGINLPLEVSMTTGNVVLDRRRMVSTGGSSPVDIPVGDYYRKQWNGGDRPPLPRPQITRIPYSSTLKPLTKAERREVITNIRNANRAEIENFKARLRTRRLSRARSADTPHPYTMEKWMTSTGTLVHKHTHPAYSTYNYTFESWRGGFTFVDHWGTSEENKLLSRLKDKLVGSDFNIGVFLAEAGPAFQLIFSAAKSLDAAIDSARRKDFKSTAYHLGLGKSRLKKERDPVRRKALLDIHDRRVTAVARAQLMISFGVMPLLSDMESGAHMVAHMVTEPQMPRVRSKVRGPRYGLRFAMGPSLARHYEGKLTTVNNGSIVAYLSMVDVPKLVGLTDVASVAWEKTPWSWLFDYAVPVGNYLKSLNIARALKGVFVKTRYVYYSYRDIRQVTTFPNSFNAVGYYPCSGSYLKVTRTVSSELSVPPLEPNLGLGYRKALNAVSALIGLEQRKRRGPANPKSPQPSVLELFSLDVGNRKSNLYRKR